MEDSRFLPEPWRFRQLWEEKLAAEKSTAATARFPEDVQLVLGVFTTRKTPAALHLVHRITWMNEPGVCPLPSGQKRGCGVYVAFVLGDSWSKGVAGPHALFLNGTENMNKGKSLAFFKHASRAYPWATHIAKMDLDTFPYLYKLTRSLHEHMGSNCDAFVGVPMDNKRCSGYPHCPPAACGLPLGGNLLNYTQQGCWSYMQGGLYIMTTDLAKAATERKSYWSQHANGIEDLKTGKAISSSGRDCIETWDPEAWDHLGSPCITGREYKCDKAALKAGVRRQR